MKKTFAAFVAVATIAGSLSPRHPQAPSAALPPAWPAA